MVVTVLFLCPGAVAGGPRAEGIRSDTGNCPVSDVRGEEFQKGELSTESTDC